MSFNVQNEWPEIQLWINAQRNNAGVDHDVWMKDLGSKALLKLAYKSFRHKASSSLSNPLIKVSPEDAIPLYLYEKKGIAFPSPAKQISEEDACLILKNELQREALEIGLAMQEFFGQPQILGALDFESTLFEMKKHIHPNS